MTLSRRLDTTHEINAALRSQFEKSTSSSFGSASFFSDKGKHGPTDSISSPTELVSLPPKRSKTGSRGALPFENTLESHAEVDEDSLDSGEHEHAHRSPSGQEGMLDVSVRIEQTVSVERTKRRLREDYRTPRTMTDSRGTVSRGS